MKPHFKIVIVPGDASTFIEQIKTGAPQAYNLLRDNYATKKCAEWRILRIREALKRREIAIPDGLQFAVREECTTSVAQD